jgi:cytochrome b6-f complex iron-sulfur subunit
MQRRVFLELVGGCVAASACSSSPASPADVGDVAAGNESALSVDSLSAIPGVPACIGRDAMGVYAMTLTCTHEGCDMGETGTVSAQGLHCGCHGSEFDVDGNVVTGPATTPLAHFAVSADAAGELTVHTGSEVDASTRLAVT